MIGFGEYGKRRGPEIVSTEDSRLLLINPTSEGFFANVLEYVAEDEDVRKFIEAVREVKEARIDKFWRPIYDPSIKGEKVVFEAGNEPAVGYSLPFWEQKAKEMPTVAGKHWSVGSEYQYYAFLTWLVNSKVESGWKIGKALEAVALDSKKLGHYYNSYNALHDFEKTGSREVCGVYDLANTFKMLSCTNEEAGGFWVAVGDFKFNSRNCPLADLEHDFDVDGCYPNSVAWLVLS